MVRSASQALDANAGVLIPIGGLMRQEQRETEKRIPYLADIPYLGVLFQYKKTKAFTSQIVIFMTMRLVEPGAFDRLGAPQAAGVIHTDFERGFIRAEVIGYDDYIKHNGEAGARAAGARRAAFAASVPGRSMRRVAARSAPIE